MLCAYLPRTRELGISRLSLLGALCQELQQCGQGCWHALKQGVGWDVECEDRGDTGGGSATSKAWGCFTQCTVEVIYEAVNCIHGTRAQAGVGLEPPL